MKLVLFLNMGGATSKNECKMFLKNMFNDYNILPIKSPFLRYLVAFLITNLRSLQMQKNYEKIGGKSPLNEITAKLCEILNEKFENLFEISHENLRQNLTLKTKNLRQNLILKTSKNKIQALKSGEISSKNPTPNLIKFDFINTYVPPFARDVLKKYKFNESDEITLFPLYPHYSQTTVKSALECVLKEINPSQIQANLAKIPALNLKQISPKNPNLNTKISHKNKDLNTEILAQNFSQKSQILSTKFPAKFSKIDIFYENEIYNALIIKHILDAKKAFKKAKILIFSAHSLPKRTIKMGDPYEGQIKAHFTLLKTRLKPHFSDIKLGFQSRLGPIKWLGPNTSDILANLNAPALIYPLSFCIDCSESVFELDIEYRKIAKQDYFVIPCPNFSAEFVEFISSFFK